MTESPSAWIDRLLCEHRPARYSNDDWMEPVIAAVAARAKADPEWGRRLEAEAQDDLTPDDCPDDIETTAETAEAFKSLAAQMLPDETVEEFIARTSPDGR